MNYEAFDEKLIRDTVGLSCIALVVFIIAIVLLIFLNRGKDDNKITRVTMYVFTIFLIVAPIIYTVRIVYDTYYDVSNHAYIEYEGTFHVSYTKSSGQDSITLYDENDTVVFYPAGMVTGGEHKGRVIYAEKNKYAFVVEVD